MQNWITAGTLKSDFMITLFRTPLAANGGSRNYTVHPNE